MLSLSIEGEAKTEALLPELSTIYNLKITAAEPRDGYYAVLAQDGVFQLHWEDDVEKTLSMLQCWDYLQNRGFPGLATLQMTSLGDLGFYLDNKLAYMTTPLSGRRGELGLKADAVRIAKTLAMLHLLSQDMPASIQNSLAQLKPIWPRFTKQLEELDLFRNMAFHRLYPTAFDLFFLKTYDEVARLAHGSIDLLAKMDIDHLGNEVELMGLLQGSCHGRAFRVTDDGNLKLPDLKGSTRGLLAKDVGAFLDNICDFAQGSLAIARSAFGAYEVIRPLQHVEQELVYSLGIFPAGMWEIANDYYKGQRKMGDPEAVEALRLEWARAVHRKEYWQRLLGDELGYEDRH